MSISLMTVAFKADLPTTQKFVLVALCDSANDQGECYPSITTLMAKCSLSDRGVQRAIRELQSAGYLSCDMRNGRSTVYLLTPERGSPRTTFTPTVVHPTPERGSPPPPNHGHPTPEPRSPITIIEPKRQEKEKALSAPNVAADVDAQVFADWVALRNKHKALASVTAINGLRKSAAKAGLSLQAAMEICCERGWRGFKAEWLAEKGAETNYARSMREKYEQVTPLIAAKAPGAVRANPMDVIEGMVREPRRIAG